VTRTAKDQTGPHSLGESTSLCADLLLIFSWKVDEVVIFGANQKRYGSLVEAPSLSVPLFDAVQCAFSSQVEHEEDGNSIVADQREHVDKLSLTTKIPDGECDLCVAYGNSFLHKIDPKFLNVILVPAAFNVFYHETCLPDLCVSNHSDLDYNAILAWLRL